MNLKVHREVSPEKEKLIFNKILKQIDKKLAQKYLHLIKINNKSTNKWIYELVNKACSKNHCDIDREVYKEVLKRILKNLDKKFDKNDRKSNIEDIFPIELEKHMENVIEEIFSDRPFIVDFRSLTERAVIKIIEQNIDPSAEVVKEKALACFTDITDKINQDPSSKPDKESLLSRLKKGKNHHVKKETDTIEIQAIKEGLKIERKKLSFIKEQRKIKYVELCKISEGRQELKEKRKGLTFIKGQRKVNHLESYAVYEALQELEQQIQKFGPQNDHRERGLRELETIIKNNIDQKTNELANIMSKKQVKPKSIWFGTPWASMGTTLMDRNNYTSTQIDEKETRVTPQAN